jgi:hypothetical protein
LHQPPHDRPFHITDLQMAALALFMRVLGVAWNGTSVRAGVCEPAGADAAERLRADTDVTHSLLYEAAACEIAA